MIIDPPAVYKMYSESIKNVRVERRPRVMMITDAPAVYKMYSESKKNVRVERRPRVLMITVLQQWSSSHYTDPQHRCKTETSTNIKSKNNYLQDSVR